MLRRIGGGLFVLAVVVVLFAFSWIRGWFVDPIEPGALSSLLAPHVEVFTPAGDGPFPAIVQFHACGGVFENQRVWARSFQDAGWMAVIVDSNTPRGLDHSDVCTGFALLGGERAGDVAVALADVRALPKVDASRIVLAGWSHGGWSIMELLAMELRASLPHNLSRMPAGGLTGIKGLVFIYPYCGIGTRKQLWSRAIPALFLMAGKDRIAPPEECGAFAEALRESGQDVTLETLEGATHAFDESHENAGGPIVYDPAATKRAIRSAVAFLDSAR